MIEKLERELKSVGGTFAPGEYIDLIAVEPDSADSVILSQKHFRFGLRAYNRGLLDRAREEFELSIEQQQRNPDALHLLGNVLWQQGYPGDAIDRYQEVLRFNGNHLGVRYSMFGVYVAEGVADSANHYLSIIVNQDRSNPQVQFLQLRCCLAWKNFFWEGSLKIKVLNINFLLGVSYTPTDTVSITYT